MSQITITQGGTTTTLNLPNWDPSGAQTDPKFNYGLSNGQGKLLTIPPATFSAVYDAAPVKSNSILVNQQPTSLSSGGIPIPNSSVVFKSPA